jgi:hypothetical protein
MLLVQALHEHLHVKHACMHGSHACMSATRAFSGSDNDETQPLQSSAR